LDFILLLWCYSFQIIDFACLQSYLKSSQTVFEIFFVKFAFKEHIFLKEKLFQLMNFFVFLIHFSLQSFHDLMAIMNGVELLLEVATKLLEKLT